MSSERSATRRKLQPARNDRRFTVADANAALVFVRRVVRDIVRNHGELMALRREREELVLASAATERLTFVSESIESHVQRLGLLGQELREVGCELKDWSLGLVDFPAEIDGRTVCLCWMLDEPAITHWHETTEGYAGRKLLDERFA